MDQLEATPVPDFFDSVARDEDDYWGLAPKRWWGRLHIG